MIAIASAPSSRSANLRGRRKKSDAWQNRYLRLLPAVRQVAKFAFRKLPEEERENAIQEVFRVGRRDPQSRGRQGAF